MVRKEKGKREQSSFKQQREQKEKERKRAALTTTLVCISVRACSSPSRTRPPGFSSAKSLRSFFFFFSAGKVGTLFRVKHV
jgi:hypothetical protein